MERDTTCNGWKNWETWNVNLWLNNEQSTQRCAYVAAQDGEDTLREYVESITIGDNTSSLAADLIGSVLDEVDWGEIRGGLLEEDSTPTCDICDKPDDGEGDDWNPETGNHKSCE